MPRLPLLVAALSVLASAALAQKIPKRPRLAASADTNDAQTYYQVGNAVIENDPRMAADAFYWSTRIDPSFADAYYGRRAAVLLSDTRVLAAYDQGQRNIIQSADMQRLDSLMSRAFMLNPILPLRYERLLAYGSIKGYFEQRYGRLSGEDEFELKQYFAEFLRNPSVSGSYRARMEQADGNYNMALDLWAFAIKNAKRKADYRIARGRLFLQLARNDSALSELTQALNELRTLDKKDFVVFYNSKAMVETTIGVAQQQLSNVDSAREAFNRALQEDLSYYPAHVKLGLLALDHHDTTTALSELELASQLRPDDGLLHDQYGFVLLSVGKSDVAAEQFTKAAELEPFFALPRRHLGEAMERLGKKSEAATAYRAFLSLAPRNDPMRGEVEHRLTALQ